VYGVFLFATLLLFYPLIYYISVPEARYRHAIEPELAILAVFLVSSFSARVQLRRQERMIADHETTASEEPCGPQKHHPRLSAAHVTLLHLVHRGPTPIFECC